MRPNWRSSGVATDDAMVSGLAPGSDEPTCIIGNSTCGSGETGRKLISQRPGKSNAKVSSEVATGRRMNGAEMLMSVRQPPDSSHRMPTRYANSRCASRSKQR